MDSIIVAMPKMEDAKKISEILKSRGLYRIENCTSGAAILSKVHGLDSGIVIGIRGYRDMHCTEIVESLPDSFEMLLLTSKEGLKDCPPGVLTLTMPFRAADLAGSVEMLLSQLNRRIRKGKHSPPKRSKEEQDCIDTAKKLLMERNNMTEPEAFRYLQKCSMDSGTNMVETAQMVILLQTD